MASELAARGVSTAAEGIATNLAGSMNSGYFGQDAVKSLAGALSRQLISHGLGDKVAEMALMQGVNQSAPSTLQAIQLQRQGEGFAKVLAQSVKETGSGILQSYNPWTWLDPTHSTEGRVSAFVNQLVSLLPIA